MVIKKLEVHPAARAAIDTIANELVSGIEEYAESKKEKQGFKTEKIISAQITDEDIQGAPIFGDTIDGKWVSRYSYRKGLCIGLSERSWPAPGSEDTELGVLMGPEVGHGETQVYARVQA